MTKNDIISHFPPGLTPRPAQAELLAQVAFNWPAADVIVLQLPPASGKTEIAYTIAHWQAARGVTTNYLVPDNVLVQQTAARYPFQHLLRKNMYQCECPDRSDEYHVQECGKARYRSARERVRRAKVRLMNTHVYRANRLYAPVVIIDEAHKVRDLLDESQTTKLWRQGYGFPDGLKTVADVVQWAQAKLATDPDNERLRRMILAVSRVRDTSTVEYTSKRFKGKPDVLLEVRASVPLMAAKQMWPWPVEKIVLMSATIGPKDIEELGLAGRRVKYLQCDSPIPAAQRPVVFKRVCNMGLKYQAHALPLLAKEILQTMQREPGKGLIHLPYGLAREIRPLLAHDRLMWHDKRDKQDVLAAYRESPPEEGAVLVASGLYEGVDLPFDDSAWQVLGKVPYLSLGDEDVKAKLEADPDWYDWQAIKLLLQAYGRMPRRPDGHGRTYIFDIAYERLLKADRARPVRMFPDHYLAATRGAS